MSVSKPFLIPAFCALAFASSAAFLDGCGTATCLRNSDCGSHMECHEGECVKSGASSTGGQMNDAAAPDSSTRDAGDAGESAGGTSSS